MSDPDSRSHRFQVTERPGPVPPASSRFTLESDGGGDLKSAAAKDDDLGNEVLADGRREELLDIAIKVVAERGLDGTSFRTLAEEAGTSTTVFTYEFGSRDELLKEIVGRAFATHWVRKGFDRDDDAEDPVGKLRRAAWQGVQSGPEIDPWVRTYDRFIFEFSFRPELAREMKELELRLMGRYLSLIDLAREQGRIEPGIPADDALFLLWSLIDGLNIHRYIYEKELDPDRTRRLFDEAFDRIMGVRKLD